MPEHKSRQVINSQISVEVPNAIPITYPKEPVKEEKRLTTVNYGNLPLPQGIENVKTGIQVNQYGSSTPPSPRHYNNFSGKS